VDTAVLKKSMPWREKQRVTAKFLYSFLVWLIILTKPCCAFADNSGHAETGESRENGVRRWHPTSSCHACISCCRWTCCWTCCPCSPGPGTCQHRNTAACYCRRRWPGGGDASSCKATEQCSVSRAATYRQWTSAGSQHQCCPGCC